MNVLVTGGAGFIGSNIVEHCIRQGHDVVVFDNLSRPGGGAQRNIGRLLAKYGDSRHFKFALGDVRNLGQVLVAMKKVDVVYHCAAQTAMTTSLEEPIDDFEVNALGTLNVLEAARIFKTDPIIFNLSTNKVYGDLTRRPIKLKETSTRWELMDCREGIDEEYPLDMEGPYGSSKGAGDTYCLDYARTFGLRTVVFRMSGIYGIGQHPTEDQGWIAWFIQRSMKNKPVTIYGDGKQVRDILYITDLINCLDKALIKIDEIEGQVYNVGGGRRNAISVLELLGFLDKHLDIRPSEVNFGPWRRADQKIYISNTAKAERDFGWKPTVLKEDGIKRLYHWIVTTDMD
ncbi:hypothetical protein LCGC14_0263430 [marine sediment metagenome]|uniref:NAD-dependent epimerase/dehydratase domain-containing protein n=1 Tax=marine sediment metagenome TaxID=412755 RepID=A0A0F9X660_9ZZZZ